MTDTLALLYSGGKDSSLAAYILSKLGYEVKPVTVTFGVTDAWKHAKEAAKVIGFEHEVKSFPRSIAEKAAEMIAQDGFPNRGINFIHKYALEKLAKEHRILADGTRRDDRVPWLEFEEIRSLEDRYGIEYIAPLRGIGYKSLNTLVHELFEVEEKNSEQMKKGDYEAEVRAVLEERGFEVKKLFPKAHKQSRVIGIRRTKDEQS